MLLCTVKGEKVACVDKLSSSTTRLVPPDELVELDEELLELEELEEELLELELDDEDELDEELLELDDEDELLDEELLELLELEPPPHTSPVTVGISGG